MKTVYIKFLDENARIQARKLKEYTHESNAVPVARIDNRSIKIK